MKIFITGSTGFVGLNLVEFYKDQELFKHNRLLNITEELNRFKPDVIINCAAEIYNADDMWIPNVLWTQECLEYVKLKPSTRMVQIGSSSEYGPLTIPGNETNRINPIDMYQATKGASTILCQGYARTYNLDISIARPYSIYGIHEKPHRLFPKLYNSFIKNEPMTLYDGVHDFIYIDDFIRGINLLIDNKNKPLGDIINFGSGKQYTNLEVLNMWQKIVGTAGNVTYIDKMNKVFESNVWICDTNYALEHYGFKTEYTLEEGIKQYIKTMEAI